MVQRKGVVAVVLVFVFVAVCRWTDPRTTRQSQSEFQVKANNLWVSVSDSKDLALVSPDETPVQPKRRLFWCGGNHGGQQIFPEMECESTLEKGLVLLVFPINSLRFFVQLWEDGMSNHFPPTVRHQMTCLSLVCFRGMHAKYPMSTYCFVTSLTERF